MNPTKFKGRILISGKGKMAMALASACDDQNVTYGSMTGVRSADPVYDDIAVHFGSTKSLVIALGYCGQYKCPLILGSTGQDDLLPAKHEYPIVVAPNTSIPIVLMMRAVEQASLGFLNLGMEPGLIESHQAEKKTLPGTAAKLSDYMQVPALKIISERRPAVQKLLGVPDEHLGGHAYHFATFTIGDLSVGFTTKVHGRKPYADGAITIASMVDMLHQASKLQPRQYSVLEIITLMQQL